MDTKELEKLARLKDKGIITEEEFNAKKDEFLGKSKQDDFSLKRMIKDVFIGLIIMLIICIFFGVCVRNSQSPKNNTSKNNSIATHEEVFYENGQQYFSPNSSVGKNCLEKVKQEQKEKYTISVNNDRYRDFLVNLRKIAEEEGECKFDRYELYGGSNILFAKNNDGETLRVGMFCAYNNQTKEYSTYFVEAELMFHMFLDDMYTFSGTLCEQLETAIAIFLEKGKNFNPLQSIGYQYQ